MTENVKDPNPNDPTPPNDPTDKPDDQMVPRDVYLKLLNEAKAAKGRARELEEFKKKLEEDELVKKGEYQKLIAQRDDELTKLRSEMQENTKREADRRRLASIIEGAGGDIDPKFYGLIDYEDVIIDPETGKIDELSKAKAIQKLKEKFPEIIRSKNSGTIPPVSPQGGLPGRISRADWLKLAPKEMRAYKADQITD